MRIWGIAVWVTSMAIGLAIVSADPPAKAQEANTRGMQLYAKKDYAHAADEFRAAIKLDDTYVLAHYNLASMAALLGDKPTVLDQLKWLRASKDPLAAKVLVKAKTDPDLKSVVDDPDVDKLLGLGDDCAQSCVDAFAACGERCGKGRSCWSGCEQQQATCNDGCSAGMSTQGVARMRAWLETPLTGRDNDKANYRVATITRTAGADGTGTYAAFVKNQFEWTCALAWGHDGSPASLSGCKSAQADWVMGDPHVVLSCAVDTKPKMEICRGAFVLVSGAFSQSGEIVLRREIK